MPQGGRKHSGGPGPLAALAGFHERLREAMGNAHVGSINQLIRCVGVGIPRNRVYEICQGREIARREEVVLLARVLTAPVEPLLAAWEDAKIAVERQELARLSTRHKDRESWHDIPLPTGFLLDILKAQNQVSDTFPYRLLGVTPPGISTIYVTPSLRQNRPPERSTHEEPTRATAPTEVPFEVSLARHEHLLVVGDPGHGKSVLGRSLVRQLSGRWLREHGTAPLSEAVVPLYVQATAVPQTGSWSSRLAHVARQSGYMVTEPEATLFADRVQGARWLVVIDGVDEIHDRDRRLELLNILHQRITNSGPYRLVITSRPLPPGELELLRDSELGEYSLLPFGPDQLAEFARNWFRVQGVADIDIEVDRFTSHIATSDLAEVSRVPLLATIALAMQTTSPGRPLPATQMELYERFVDELLHARGAPPSTVQENVIWWSWLHTARPALLSYLAQLHWDKEVDLVTAAVGWVKQQRPIDLQLPREAEEYVVQTLIASGLVTFNGSVLRFIHQSIIEFLAGLHLASQAGNSFSSIKKWVDPEKILDSKKLALFTVASWCRIEATDGSQVVRALLGEKRGSVNALVELISVGVDIDPDMEEVFVERLIDLFRYNSSSSQGLAENVAKVKRLPSLSLRLEEVAINDVLHPDSRIEAAVAYARCYSMPRGVAILVEISQSVDATNRLGALYELYDLGYEFSKLTSHARHILADAKAGAWTRVNAAILLKDCNDLDGVVEVVKKIAAESETTDGDFTHAAEFLIEHGGMECVRLVMEMIGNHRHDLISDLGGIVRVMSAVDAHAETTELAQRYLRHPEAGQDEEEIREVLAAWASSAFKTGCGDEIVAELRSMRISQWELTDLANILRKAGLCAEAVGLLKDLVSRLKQTDSWPLARALRELLDIDAVEHLSFVMENVTDAVLVDIPVLVDYMAKLRSSELIDSARRLLNRDSEPMIRAKAIAAWLRADEFSSGDILSAVRRLNPPSGERLAYARQMWLHGFVEPACRLAGEVLSDSVATSEYLLQALIIIIRAGGRADAFRGVELLRNNPRCTPSERAWIAAELGALDECGLAVDLWLDALVATDLSIEERVRAAEELRLVGAADEASSRIGIAVQRSNLVAAEVDRLKRLRAWMI